METRPDCRQKDLVRYSHHLGIQQYCKKKHYWPASINSRSKGRGCPYCSNRKIGFGNDLQSKNPKLAKEWHPTKNTLKPNEVIAGGTKKAWWKCKYNHEWEALIGNRVVHGAGCPKCSSQTSRAELYIFSEFLTIFKEVENRAKIGKDEIDIFIKDFNLGVEYDGSFYHKNKFQTDKIKKNRISKFITLINIREIPLEKIFHSDFCYDAKNTKYYDLVVGLLNHIINNKICESKKLNSLLRKYLKEKKPRNEKFFKELISYLPGPIKEKSLLIENPKLSEQWHPTKNGKLKPRNFTSKSSWRSWWLCDNGHEWDQTIHARSRNKEADCPICSGYRLSVGDNDFQTLHPDLAKEWHPHKNKEKTPSQFRPGSHEPIWWLCKEGHEWKCEIRERFIRKNRKQKNCEECYKK